MPRIAPMVEITNLSSEVCSRRQNIRRALLSWFKRHPKRYPWRRPRASAYEVLLAELLLKRTTATAAARAYRTFVKEYPTVERLAAASEDDLAQSFQPIGLAKQRARSTHRLALTLAGLPNGIPASLLALLSLPGIGEYSARAILSFGYRVPVALVDGNVERVIRRVFQNALVLDEPKSAIRNIAEKLVPPKDHRAFNFALIDLGKSVCRPAKPLCHDCPLRAHCDYTRGPQEPPLSSLRVHRQAKGLSLQELARRAGVSKLTIINIEAARTQPRDETLKKIARAMDVDTAHIQDPPTP